VSVPGGCFTHKEGQEFCVSDFRIGKFEVTQAQWESVMENNPSYYLSCGDDCPVERVSWDDAQEFINILNAKSGKSYRLPTEAEWEYACRSVGRNEEYCGGNNYDAVAWQGGNSVDTTHKVGTRKPNGLGIYDMSGNVWEWCSDWYGLFSNGKLQDYKGPASGKFRVIRGGSWDFISDYASSTYRSWNTPDSRSYSTGFRLVLPAANNTKAKQ
jgi:formylglycine-generating enzyme required for sulfatase activity